MLSKGTIHVMIIRLEIDRRINFSLLLSAEGSINRIGTGRKANDDNSMYSGFNQERLFEQVLAHVPDALFDKQGEYEIKDRQGRLCEMVFYFANQKESETARFKFVYGSESMGPPMPFVQLFAHARKITDGWYQRQRQIAEAMAMKG